MLREVAVAVSMAGVLLFPGRAVAEDMLILPGTGYWNGKTHPERIGSGFFPDATPVIVDYPAGGLPLGVPGRPGMSLSESVGTGVANTESALTGSTRPTELVGLSQGALVLDEVQRDLADDPQAPLPNELTFVMFSDPSRGLFAKYLPEGTHIPIVDWTVQTPVESQYHTYDVYGEYDFWRDPPDRPGNLLAVVNSLMADGGGDKSVHIQAGYADIDDVPAANITESTNSAGGVVTTVRVPTEDLPLTQPVRKVFGDKAADRLDAKLRPRIDRAYVRNDKPGDTRPYVSGGKIVHPKKPVHKLRDAVRKIREARQ